MASTALRLTPRAGISAKRWLPEAAWPAILSTSCGGVVVALATPTAVAVDESVQRSQVSGAQQAAEAFPDTAAGMLARSGPVAGGSGGIRWTVKVRSASIVNPARDRRGPGPIRDGVARRPAARSGRHGSVLRVPADRRRVVGQEAREGVHLEHRQQPPGTRAPNTSVRTRSGSARWCRTRTAPTPGRPGRCPATPCPGPPGRCGPGQPPGRWLCRKTRSSNTSRSAITSASSKRRSRAEAGAGSAAPGTRGCGEGAGQGTGPCSHSVTSDRWRSQTSTSRSRSSAIAASLVPGRVLVLVGAVAVAHHGRTLRAVCVSGIASCV